MILRSPNAYTDLRGSGFLILPSQRILRYHKNKIKQDTGIAVVGNYSDLLNEMWYVNFHVISI